VQQKFDTEAITKINEWLENEFKKQPLLTLEYFTIADEKTLKTAEKKDINKTYRAFIAVFAGDIRLIDNIGLKN
jgi:pantoate--beta-alanine ligase